jgi:deoxycytidylate deaminase
MLSEPIKLPSFLNLAKKMAFLSSGDYRLGSVVIKAGRVLAKGINRYWNSNSLSKEFFKFNTVHAEMDSLGKLERENIKGTILYVARVRKDGSFGCSKPCSRCQKALKALGVRKIVYSTEEYPYFQIEKIN